MPRTPWLKTPVAPFGFASPHKSSSSPTRIARAPAAVAEDLVKALADRGFPSRVETVNALEAFLGSLPGHGYPNLRRPVLSTRNLADLLPVTSVWSGLAKNPCSYYPPNSPPLLWAATDGATPFRVNLHESDVGHALVLGPTGAGKSVLLGTLAVQFLRYARAQVFAFDVGYSLWAIAHAVQGSHYDLAAGAPDALKFQPLGDIDRPTERAWAAEWIEMLATLQGLPVTASHRARIDRALALVAENYHVHRTLSELTAHLQEAGLVAALRPYTVLGNYGELVDAAEDDLGTSRFTVFEMKHLLALDDKVALPVLLYLFHRIRAAVGRESHAHCDRRGVDGPPPRTLRRQDHAVALDAEEAERRGGPRDPKPCAARATPEPARGRQLLPDQVLPPERGRGVASDGGALSGVRFEPDRNRSDRDGDAQAALLPEDRVAGAGSSSSPWDPSRVPFSRPRAASRWKKAVHRSRPAWSRTVHRGPKPGLPHAASRSGAAQSPSGVGIEGQNRRTRKATRARAEPKRLTPRRPWPPHVLISYQPEGETMKRLRLHAPERRSHVLVFKHPPGRANPETVGPSSTPPPYRRPPRGRRRARSLRLAAGIVLVALCAGRAQAQWTVYDPANYAENVLHYVNQLTQIKYQLDQIGYQLQALAKLPSTAWRSVTAPLTAAQQVMGAARSLGYAARNVPATFAQTFTPARIIQQWPTEEAGQAQSTVGVMQAAVTALADQEPTVAPGLAALAHMKELNGASPRPRASPRAPKHRGGLHRRGAHAAPTGVDDAGEHPGRLLREPARQRSRARRVGESGPRGQCGARRSSAARESHRRTVRRSCRSIRHTGRSASAPGTALVAVATGLVLLALLAPHAALAQGGGAPTPPPVLDALRDMYRTTAATWRGRLTPIAQQTFVILAGIEFAVSGLIWTLKRESLDDLAAKFLLKFTLMAVMLTVVTAVTTWVPPIINGFIAAGEAAVGVHGTASASDIVDIGRSASMSVLSQLSFSVFMKDPAIVIWSALASFVLFVSFAIVAAQVILVTIEAAIVVYGAMPLFLSFAGSRWTAALADHALSYAVYVGVKMFLLYLIVGAGIAVARTWVTLIQDVTPAPSPLYTSAVCQIVAGAFVFLILTVRVPNSVASRLTGQHLFGIAHALRALS